MEIILKSPRKSLNKAYLKVKPLRSEIELFKKNLIGLLDGLDETESEEHNKNDLVTFLKNTFYQQFYVNTKERTDLVIHSGPDSKSLPGIMIEAKKPSNKSEMIRPDNLNAKAFHELILYYLRERITNHNLEIKHLIVTNIYEWFVFDAILFEKTFAGNKKLVQQFNDFEEGRLIGKNTDFFYKEIAEPFVAELDSEVCFTWFDFREYDKPLRNEDKRDDSKLIALYKLLSPEHLLKLPFANDSNSLDRGFYSELLHIIGLSETKEGSKKLIGRKNEGERNSGSLIESAIIQLDNLDKISRLEKPAQFGDTVQERLFSVALELSITWINRILFLKLLEAQMIRYHKGDPAYAFLNCEKVQNFDDLNTLFFGVLARMQSDRNEDVRKLYTNVPYLNSSLFEPTVIEHSCLFISQLKDGKLPILASTVLKNNNGKKVKGELFTLEYLFKFLDAYDFAGEGSEEIQEENKTLINASVLGLIFEKINGYKDGSFFTPGFITMYMCQETIRRAVLQKFKDTKGWECQDLKELYNKIVDLQEANKIINDLKICDPAVGSGHFLVSALNEIIAIKSELRILSDGEGKRLKEYHVEVVNDELIITDEDGDLFEYNPSSPESQRVQETMFREKQTIIENCLFGVDINPNSVKICRLRLWIELLKNAYYKQPHPPTPSPKGEGELETLPNIDINIKCGNSLISRYSLDADIKLALKKSKWSIDSYRLAVMSYRNATSKEEKRTMERLIESIKSDFETEVAANDKRLLQLKKLSGDLFNLTQQTSLFERTKKELAEWNKQVNELTVKIKKLETELEGIKNNKIYENAFEWRFEFPEVLNNEGDFEGFDVVIGNPPYGASFSHEDKKYIQERFLSYKYRFDSYIYFVELGLIILKKNGYLEFITPILWLTLENCYNLRSIVIKENDLRRIFIHGESVFEEAVVNTCSFQVQKSIPKDDLLILRETGTESVQKSLWIDTSSLQIDCRTSQKSKAIVEKVKKQSINLFEFGEIIQGLTTYDKYQGQSEEIIKNRAFHFDHKHDDTCGKWLEGKNVNRYSISWGNEWLSYGDWLGAPREKKFFEGRRILFREVPGKGKRIQACITEDEFYYGHSITPFKPFEDHQKDLEYILGIANSKLISWFGRYTLTNFGKDVFPKLNPNDVKELPVPKTFLLYEKISNIVQDILIAKNTAPFANTIEQEAAIDLLVYELYGLTDDEIKIVENEMIE
ncbi:MAG: Eco57I restriction-modification methylase domain-containing protein [Bacteroidales bacterium]|nr:Eco57I restriction-modification methylase domain-containing protein [Bacteroidales bacterium]